MSIKKVSVIVPAYNAHNTLARCLGSLVNQTIQDIEIIVVNDASSDDTYEIMHRCHDQFPDKVRIINNDINRGSGGARNCGFDVAEGEYIGLVDSDDYVASNMFELLYAKAKEGDYDIVDCGYYSERNDKAMLFTGDNVTGQLNDAKRKILISSGGYLVTKIFKKELWNDPPIRMREKVRCLEDTEILIYMLLRAGSIGNVKEVLYNYCDIADSATKTMDLQAYFDSIYGAISAIYERCKGIGTFEGAIEAIEYAVINLYSYGINRCLFESISKYGVSESYIKKYFDNAGKNEKELLMKLAWLKNSRITGNYMDNQEVVKRISLLDIHIMEECDRRYGNPIHGVE